MKKTWITIMMVMVAMFFASQAVAGWWGSPDQEYFDKQFNQLQRSVSEVKGDTTQIVSILGKVFEGSVPKGGTLTSLCNSNGWNLIVVMGHGGVSDPDTVAAGAKFNYPKTAEEFQAALKKGKPLYDAWLSKQKTTFRVNRIKVDTIELEEFRTKFFRVTEEAKIQKATIDQLEMRMVDITEELRIKKEHIGRLEIDQEHHKDAVYDKLRIKQLEIDNLKELLAKAQTRYTELQARPSTTTKPVVSKVCKEGEECGNRNSNPKWSFIRQESLNGIPLIYGKINIAGGPWIQSKWFVPNREIQIVVTNWDGKSDISSRLAAAEKKARQTGQEIKSKQLSADCGQRHCYVCEH